MTECSRQTSERRAERGGTHERTYTSCVTSRECEGKFRTAVRSKSGRAGSLVCDRVLACGHCITAAQGLFKSISLSQFTRMALW